MIVITASASAAISIVVRTRPLVSGRRSVVHRLPAAGATAGVATSAMAGTIRRSRRALTSGRRPAAPPVSHILRLRLAEFVFFADDFHDGPGAFVTGVGLVARLLFVGD